MILSLLIIALAFIWLGIETNWLRVRLPYGKALELQPSGIITSASEVMPPEPIKSAIFKCDGGLSDIPCPNNAEWENQHGVKVCEHHKLLLDAFTWENRSTRRWTKLYTEVKPPEVLLLPEVCTLTHIQRELDCKQYRDSWRPYGTGYNTRRKTSYQQMVFDNQTITLDAELPNLYDLIAEVQKTLDSKPRQPSFKPIPLHLFIEQVQTGSHQEPETWIANDGKEYTSTRTVIDYKSVYHDCLVSKAWLKKHEHDLDGFEPSIELSIDDKAFSVNGNYKQGALSGFMEQYTQKVRAGKKTMTIMDNQHIVNCGGGVYIAEDN